MKMVGERPLNALVDGLADVRKAKVKEAYEKATVKCKAATGPAVSAAAKVGPTKKPLPAKKIIAGFEDEPPKTVGAKPPVKAVRNFPYCPRRSSTWLLHSGQEACCSGSEEDSADHSCRTETFERQYSARSGCIGHIQIQAYA
jgi:hypothetical protein